MLLVRTGPPTAPRITASAPLAAMRAWSVNGEPVASIDACNHNHTHQRHISPIQSTIPHPTYVPLPASGPEIRT